MILRNCDRCGGFPECSGDDVKPHSCQHNRKCVVDGCDKCAAIEWPQISIRVGLSKAGDLAKRRARTAGLRDYRRKNKLCPDCGRKIEEHVYCANCREAKADCVDAIRQARAERGVCVYCGKAPATNGLYCEEHYTKLFVKEKKL